MIVGFDCKDTERVWQGKKTRKWDDKVVKVALRKLFMLNAANHINDLRIPPSNRLHPLKKGRAGYYSISVNMQWRIIFWWHDNHANNVKIVDYH